MDGKIDRRSHLGEYRVLGGCPFNPVGRTGIIGRGLLGRWGPNHAADPIVTRWKRSAEGNVITNTFTQKYLNYIHYIINFQCLFINTKIQKYSVIHQGKTFFHTKFMILYRRTAYPDASQCTLLCFYLKV